jgi:hypothetical protein
MRPYLEKAFTKNRAGGVAQGEDPESKPQYCQKKKKQRNKERKKRKNLKTTKNQLGSIIWDDGKMK